MYEYVEYDRTIIIMNIKQRCPASLLFDLQTSNAHIATTSAEKSSLCQLCDWQS